MDPFVLKVIFTGLIAFVPIYNDSAKQPDHVWVLLIDARQPDPKEDAFNRPFDPHYPALRFAKQTSQGPRKFEFSCYSPFLMKCKAIVIENESLTIVTTANSIPTQLHLDKTFDWLIPLSKVHPGLKDVSSATIVAKIRIDRGTLATLDLETKDGQPEVVDFYPRPANSQFNPRFVARRMILTIGGLKGNVTLMSSKLHGGTDPPNLNLAPPAQCSGNCEVILEVMNSPRKIIEKTKMNMHSRRHFELMWQSLGSKSVKAVPAFVSSPPGGDLLCPEVRP